MDLACWWSSGARKRQAWRHSSSRKENAAAICLPRGLVALISRKERCGAVRLSGKLVSTRCDL